MREGKKSDWGEGVGVVGVGLQEVQKSGQEKKQQQQLQRELRSR